MIDRIKAWAGVAATACLLVACGGGSSGGAGSPVLGGGDGTGGGSTTTTYQVAVSIQRSGAVVSTITSTETVQAVAVVSTTTGTPVEGVVVTISESGAGLLKLAPTSGTALTDASGVARVDVSATLAGSTGATTVTAAATVAGTDYTGSATLAVQAGAIVDIPATPTAINFVGVVPADQAIVIKGAGGNGRSESASLSFKVVDGSNAPIKGALVNFSANPADKVTLNITSAESDANGLVTTTVQSGSEPTSVVITARAAANTAVTGQSDTLVISNGVAVAGGFEIVAEKYNLDGGTTGDDTTVSAFVRDQFGNPVPDGLAVSFTTDFGAVASSQLGGCLTLNGTCDVTFRVQEPRGTGLATVVGTVRVSSSLVLSDDIQINMAGASGLLALNEDGTFADSFALGSCKQKFSLLLVDAGTGRSPPAASTISVRDATSDISVSVSSGSPVDDMPSPSFPPAPFVIEVDASGTTLRPVCNAAGTVKPGGFVLLAFTTPNGRSSVQRFDLSYPQ